MKKKLTDNLLLKIVSVLIAILIWVVIANINDPIVSATYNVPVNIINGAYIESIGKTYRVAEEDQDQKVKVVMRGKSSVVENRSIDDIEAVADLTQIVNMDTVPYVVVPVTVTCDNVQPENITVTPQSIKIVLEDKANQEFIVGVDIQNKPDSQYAVGEVTAKPEKVKIMGPTSLIQKIDRVVATFDVGDITEDTMGTSGLIIYDKNGEDVTASSMDYLKFDIGDPIVAVNVKLWQVVPNVQIKVVSSGSPGSGYHVANVSSTPTEIGIAGTEEALKALREKGNVIEIPASEISVKGATSDVEKKIDLTQFLPPDTKLSSDVTTAIVTANILPVGSKSFVLQTQNIEVLGLSSELTFVPDTDEVTINISGPEAVLRTIKEETFDAQIDLSGKTIGTHKVPIKITVPPECELLEDVSINVDINALE